MSRISFRRCCSMILVLTLVQELSAQTKQSSLSTTPLMPTVRTESGVKVFQHDRTAFTRAPQLELVGSPVTVIGGADGDDEHELTYAQYITLLPDGRVATLSPVGNKYYVFGADGAYQRTLGRSGKGPGEYIRPSGNLLLGGDTLLIIDDANSQITWFHPDKGFIKAKARGTESRLRSEKAMGVLPGGGIVVSSAGLVQSGELQKVTRPPASVAVISYEGKALGQFQIPDLELYKMNVVRRGQSHPETMVRGFSPGAEIAVWDSSIATGTADAYRIDIANASGVVRSRIVVNSPRVPVTAAMREARIQRTMQWYRNMPGEGGVKPNLAEIEKSERDLSVADSLPAYSRFLTTPDKTLWVVDAVAPNANTWTATAFRRDGAIVGRLRADGAGTPVAFGNDRVVIRTEDADGVVTLTVRRIGVASAKAR